MGVQREATVVDNDPAVGASGSADKQSVGAIVIESRTDKETEFGLVAETASNVAVNLFGDLHTEGGEGVLAEVVAFTVEAVVCGDCMVVAPGDKVGHLDFNLWQGEIPLVGWVVGVGAGHRAFVRSFEELYSFFGSVGAMHVWGNILNEERETGSLSLG